VIHVIHSRTPSTKDVEMSSTPVAESLALPVVAPEPVEAEHANPLSRAAGIGALLVLAITQLMVVLDNTIINVALPTIQRSLGIGESSLAWIVNGYVLGFGALLLLGARVGDMLGRRNVMQVAIVMFGLASFVGGIGPDERWMITARVVQGVSAAFAQSNALSLIVSTFAQGPARNRALGVFAAMEGLGATAGLLLGGMLVEWVSWRWVFLVNVPIALGIVVFLPRFLGQPARQRVHLDLPGALTSSIGLGSLVYGFHHAASHGWSDGITMGTLLAGVVGLAAFAVIETRSPEPLIPLWVFRDRNRGGAYMTQLVIGAALFGMFFLVTLFFQNVLGFGALRAGMAFIPATLGIIVTAGIVSQIVSRTGVRPLAATGLAISSVGLFLFTRITPDSSYVPDILVPMVLLALGLGLTLVPLTISAVSGVEESQSGLVSGVSMTTLQIGGALGLSILSTVATSTIDNRLAAGAAVPAALTDGYTDAFLIAAVMVAAAIPVVLAFLRLRPEKGVGLH
jgi:EmrB/QacA subfamily drug resistance transporter